MADKNIDLNALGQAMDTSFTRSSASSGPVLNTHSIKAGFVAGDKIRVKVVYTTTVNMVRDRDIVESKVRFEKEGDSYIEAASKQIIKDYKEQVGKSIKLNRVDVGTSVEIVDLNVMNQKRSALLRRVAIFDVG